MDTPEGVEIEVVESTQEKAYLVIPPKPVGELSDEDLDKVAGGSKTGPVCRANRWLKSYGDLTISGRPKNPSVISLTRTWIR